MSRERGRGIPWGREKAGHLQACQISPFSIRITKGPIYLKSGAFIYQRRVAWLHDATEINESRDSSIDRCILVQVKLP